MKTSKNDAADAAADAAAIATAARQPEMPVVSIKSAEQQAVLSIHRARAGLVKCGFQTVRHITRPTVQ